jgi:hypothetical protein
MNTELPPFLPQDYLRVHALASRAFSRENDRDQSYLLHLQAHPDHHYRAIFRLDYFYIAEGMALPSKSQWTTLKRRLKRLNKTVFVYKECGLIDPPAGLDYEGRCAYVDFGFMAL